MEKLIIIGSGISGLTAALYGARATLDPLVISGYEEGGQLMLTTVVENFPGFPDGINGPDLIANTKKQAEKFGTRFKQDNVKAVSVKSDGIVVVETDSEKIETQALIVATGASANWLNISSELPFRGRGVHTCATCDGFFYKDKEIFVVGGGDSACEEGSFLTKFAKKVTVLVRKDALKASKIMQERLMSNPKVKMMWNSAIVEFKGQGQVSSVMIQDTVTKKITEHKTDGVFLAIGHTPNTAFLKGVVELDEHGFMKTDRKLHTNVPGIFASGDVQDHIYKQAITAAGTGCQAVLEAEKYLALKNRH